MKLGTEYLHCVLCFSVFSASGSGDFSSGSGGFSGRPGFGSGTGSGELGKSKLYNDFKICLR